MHDTYPWPREHSSPRVHVSASCIPTPNSMAPWGGHTMDMHHGEMHHGEMHHGEMHHVHCRHTMEDPVRLGAMGQIAYLCTAMDRIAYLCTVAPRLASPCNSDITMAWAPSPWHHRPIVLSPLPCTAPTAAPTSGRAEIRSNGTIQGPHGEHERFKRPGATRGSRGQVPQEVQETRFQSRP